MMLPPRVREAIALGRSRLPVAHDGHLPRLLQREVIATFWPDVAPPRTASRARMLENLRSRELRLVELRAPIQVLLGQVSKLRAIERLPETEEEPDLVSPDEERGFARKTALWRLMLDRFGSANPRVRVVCEDLAALAIGKYALAWDAAEELEAEWEARPDDPGAAIGHFAFAALDDASGEGRRTDQDDLGDIAERAFSAGLMSSGLAGSARIEARRAWWKQWLVELVPAAYGVRVVA